MKTRRLAAVVLAAGKGTRMRSDLPKVLHRIAGRPMVLHILDTVTALAPDRVVVVVGPGMEAVAAAVAPHPTAVQPEQRGTGDAVAAARAALGELAAGTDPVDVLVLFGDTPFVSGETMRAMLDARAADADPALVVLGMRAPEPNEYGRLVTDPDGGLRAIVEWRDASPDERRLPLSNAGVMAVDGRILFDLVDRLGTDNAKGERYLTDIVALARAAGRRTAFVEGDPAELIGINSRSELARAEAILQARLRERAMAGGATLVAPETVFLSADTALGRDVVVGPFVTFGPGVAVGDRVEIKGFCHFEGCRIEPGAIVGPYARLRPGAEIGPDVHIGNFVEVKAARLDRGAKANHLAYIGDAHVGAKANIGAGTITCNYDGFLKHRTEIGAGAFIGSNTALVAPVAVGAGAIVGAGSVVTSEVAPDALMLERSAERQIPDWARLFRERMAAARRDAK